eukprot:TRINITY_DN544_c0_g1_i3.p1 TRINITY_DN544_c0_g1~~TRINITY_DN544_c0_g1_i3.p1  ORF type:complete len:810 (-),score=190.40 TRINITY_DN544_c0_g1_i3:169-2598(-)
MGRKSAGQKRNESFSPSSISFDMLSRNFHRPLKEVSKDLGVCSTMLKKICRGFGIKRWPHRKIRSLNRMIRSLETSAPASAEEAEQVQQEIVLLHAKVQNLVRRGELHGDDDSKSEPGSPSSSTEASPVISKRAVAPTPKTASAGPGPQRPVPPPFLQPAPSSGVASSGLPLGPSPGELRASELLNMPRSSDSLTLLLQAGAYDSDNWVDCVRQWAAPAPLGDSMHSSSSEFVRFPGLMPYRSGSAEIGLSRSMDLESLRLEGIRRPTFDPGRPPTLSDSMLFVPGGLPRKAPLGGMPDLVDVGAQRLTGSASLSDIVSPAAGTPVTASMSMPTLPTPAPTPPTPGPHPTIKSESLSSVESATSQSSSDRDRGKKRTAGGDVRGPVGDPDPRSPRSAGPFSDPRAPDLRSAAAAADPRAAQYLPRFAPGVPSSLDRDRDREAPTRSDSTLTRSGSGLSRSGSSLTRSDSGLTRSDSGLTRSDSGRSDSGPTRSDSGRSDSAPTRSDLGPTRSDSDPTPPNRIPSFGSTGDVSSPIGLVEGSPSFGTPLPQPVTSSASLGSLLAPGPLRSFPPVFSGSWPRASLSTDGLFNEAFDHKLPGMFPSESPSGEQFFDMGARPHGLTLSDSLPSFGRPGVPDLRSASMTPSLSLSLSLGSSGTPSASSSMDSQAAPSLRDSAEKQPGEPGAGDKDGRKAGDKDGRKAGGPDGGQAHEGPTAAVAAALGNMVFPPPNLNAQHQQYMAHAMSGLQYGFPFGPFPFMPPGADPAMAYRQAMFFQPPFQNGGPMSASGPGAGPAIAGTSASPRLGGPH